MKSFWWSAWLVGLLGCGAGTAGFGLTVPSRLTVTQGAGGQVDVAVDRGSGFGGDVTVSLDDAPPGITAQPLTLRGSQSSGALMLALASSSPVGGPFAVTVAARASGTVRYATLDLLVRGPPGTLDPRFGEEGKLAYDLGMPGAHGLAQAIAGTADGRIVVAGRSYDDKSQIFVARFSQGGGLDSSFGQRGVVTTAFCDQSNVRADALIVQPNGSLVVAGGTDCSGKRNEFALVRYLGDGTLDPGFGPAGNGRLTTDFDGIAQARALVLQPDGKLVAGGSVIVPSQDPSGLQQELFALARYNPDGTLDASFGTDGKVTLAFEEGLVGALNALALQPDGKIVAAGAGGLLRYSALARFGPDGRVDTGFGSGGKILNAIGANSEVFALALQPDGLIVTAGTANDGNNNFNFALARYQPNGAPDPLFGAGGASTIDFSGGNDYARAIVLSDDGKILVCGSTGDSTSSRFALVRIRPDGHSDDTFGNVGKTVTDFVGGYAGAFAAMGGPDGSLVVAGSTGISTSPNLDIALARYWE